MGSRSRKRRIEAPRPDETMRRGYARGRERDAAIRESLEPLAPGERPRAVTVAAIVALGFAIANVTAVLAGVDLSSEDSNPAAMTVLVTAVLLIAAAGMWLGRYWAVLGFQIILALQIIAGSLALIRVEKWWIAVGLTVLLGLLGWLFWKLVRAMARLQMPDRPQARPKPDSPPAALPKRRKRTPLATHLARTKAMWPVLEEHGVAEGDELTLEFFFDAPGEAQAKALADFLQRKRDYAVEVDSEGGWSVDGSTVPMRVSQVRLETWVRWMVATGSEHGCRFDGWGAAATRA
jgi:Regulator of ribonuclease activity B